MVESGARVPPVARVVDEEGDVRSVGVELRYAERAPKTRKEPTVLGKETR